MLTDVAVVPVHGLPEHPCWPMGYCACYKSTQSPRSSTMTKIPTIHAGQDYDANVNVTGACGWDSISKRFTPRDFCGGTVGVLLLVYNSLPGLHGASRQAKADRCASGRSRGKPAKHLKNSGSLTQCSHTQHAFSLPRKSFQYFACLRTSCQQRFMLNGWAQQSRILARHAQVRMRRRFNNQVPGKTQYVPHFPIAHPSLHEARQKNLLSQVAKLCLPTNLGNR